MYSIFCEYCAVGTSANLGINLFSLQSVPLGRLELPLLTEYAPQAYVYANFTTAAKQ